MNWNDYFINLAKMVSMKSNCCRRGVGAVLVKEKRVIATGYNGVPSGFPHCEKCYGGDRVSGHGLDDLPCEHAEKNCLLQCSKYGISSKGTIMYCTNMPCNTCLKAIISAEIQKVIYEEEYHLNDNKAEALRQYLLSEACSANGFTVERWIPYETFIWK